LHAPVALPRHIFYCFNAGVFSLEQDDLDDIKAPGEVTGAEEAEPFAGPALHEFLLLVVDRVKGSTKFFTGAGLYFHEAQGSAVACHDVDFTASGSAEIAVKDSSAFGPQVGTGDFLTQRADREMVVAECAAGPVEERAEPLPASKKECSEHGSKE